MRMLGPGGGADAELVGRVGGPGGGWEVVALLSFLAFWGLGAGAPLFRRACFGGTGGGGAGGAWGRKKGCVACWPLSRSGGSAGVCMVPFAWLRVKSASLCTLLRGVFGPRQCGRAVVKRMVEVVVPHLVCLHDPGLRGFPCVWTARGSLSLVQCRVEGFPWGALAACEGGALEELRDGVFGALRWWGHRWDGSGVPVVFVSGEGV